MTGFLTENARRAYPLESWPRGVDARWVRSLLDASVGYAGVPEDGRRVSLVSVSVKSGMAVYRIGTSGSDYVDVSVRTGLGGRAVVFGSSARYRAFLTVDGAVVDGLVASAVEGASVGVPLAGRCATYATRFVESVSAYASLDKDGNVSCDAVAFDGSESPVATAAGDVTFAAKDGIDLDTTQTDPSSDVMLRVSAIAAAADSEETSKDVDVVIRGDDCITVEALPGAYVAAGGAIVSHAESPDEDVRNDPASCGVIRIGTKCKPCCQCEDYRDAAEMLRPSAAAAEGVKELLDGVKGLYEAAVAEFERAKVAAVAAVGSYDNIRASATTACSGGVCTEAVAEGTRHRISITFVVSNMTLETATVSDVAFVVGGGYGRIKTQWAAAGESPGSGTAVDGQAWQLSSGDSLTVVATYSKTAKSNNATKPAGMKATFTASLPPNADIPGRETSKEMEVAVA